MDPKDKRALARPGQGKCSQDNREWCRATRISQTKTRQTQCALLHIIPCCPGCTFLIMVVVLAVLVRVYAKRCCWWNLGMNNLERGTLINYQVPYSYYYTIKQDIKLFWENTLNFGIALSKYRRGMRNALVSRPQWRENSYLHLLAGDIGQCHRRLT